MTAQHTKLNIAVVNCAGEIGDKWFKLVQPKTRWFRNNNYRLKFTVAPDYDVDIYTSNDYVIFLFDANDMRSFMRVMNCLLTDQKDGYKSYSDQQTYIHGLHSTIFGVPSYYQAVYGTFFYCLDVPNHRHSHKFLGAITATLSEEMVESTLDNILEKHENKMCEHRPTALGSCLEGE
jgi:hypothetical protein